MARARKPARRTRSFASSLARLIGGLVVLFVVAMAGKAWLADHPHHNPFAPLDLRDPRGWATGAKLAALQSDTEACHATLERSAVAFSVLQPVGEGACRRPDRMVLDGRAFWPANPQMTCPVAIGLEFWIAHDVQRLAQDILGSRVARIEQLGTYNCRAVGGATNGRWSEHATGNAIDVAAFVLKDGRRISLLGDWDSGGAESRFLHQIRDAACASFGTVLSPDYNNAHANHFHLDQSRPATFSACR